MFDRLPTRAWARQRTGVADRDGFIGGREVPDRTAGPVETLILNLVPLALVASPALGIAQALVLTGRRRG